MMGGCDGIEVSILDQHSRDPCQFQDVHNKLLMYSYSNLLLNNRYLPPDELSQNCKQMSLLLHESQSFNIYIQKQTNV